MGRPRKELGPGADSLIIDLMSKGGTAESIGKALGVPKTTAFRRMQELRGPAVDLRKARREEAKNKLPEDVADLSEDTPLEQITRWLAIAQEEVDVARASNDIDQTNKALRIAAMLLALKQKATPIEPPDPNANPNFVEAAKRARQRWHELIERVK